LLKIINAAFKMGHSLACLNVEPRHILSQLPRDLVSYDQVVEPLSHFFNNAVKL
jgi:hypothetical protein